MSEQPPTFEERRYGHDLLREDAHRAHDKNTEFHTYVNKEAILASSLTLRTLVIINGGAAISVLTFLGGVASKEKIDFDRVGVVASTLKWFAFGVALAVAGMSLSYLTHFAMTGIASTQVKSWDHPFVVDGPKTGRWRVANQFLHVGAILAAIGSLALFLTGMFAASDAVAHLLVK
jgi:hypothetical protein